MIQKIHIQNFKSIVDLAIPLSNINVFIGENGCGKSNILESVGFVAEAAQGITKSLNQNLSARGIRIAKPSLLYNSFPEVKQPHKISVEIEFENGPARSYSIELHGDFEVLRNVVHEDDSTYRANWTDYLIYSPHLLALRGLSNQSLMEPIGINGENLDVLLASFDEEEMDLLRENAGFIEWLSDFYLDTNDKLKFESYKMGRGTSRLYFKDKFMQEENNIFSAENANEGVLVILFYLSLFISKRTPDFFAIDNIESGLNPKLCRDLMKKLSELAILKNKQVLITTHNPAILDGLNLNDDRQRLFVVKRNDDGHTNVERIKTKPSGNGEQLKLSEMWMRGYLGALPTNF